jgi:hypothetical protein
MRADSQVLMTIAVAIALSCASAPPASAQAPLSLPLLDVATAPLFQSPLPSTPSLPSSMLWLSPSLEQPPAARAPAEPPRDDPFPRRPMCSSMFLKSDWQLTSKQRACDWMHNRVFASSAFWGAIWSAGSSKVLDRASEEGDSFAKRFGHKFSQNAFKATGSYVGGLVFREDPRTRPPYLSMRTAPRPRGFFKRTGHALAGNLISYRCTGGCTSQEDIKKVPALSRVLGSLASGAASEFWEAGRASSGNRALRGAASAYASTFANALFSEFKPELSAAGNKAFRAVFGGR